MATYVKCPLCNERFDRESQAYVKINSRRYAHADCALRAYAANPVGEKPEVIDPNDIVICEYCKETFNKSKENFKLYNGKYFHEQCYELEQKRELTDQEKLERYILELFKVDYVPPRIQKQIKRYVSEYSYTYSGIQKALTYWYEIKGHPVDPRYRDTIGIVESVYQSAYRYYYAIWEAQQQTEYIVADPSAIMKYVPKVVEVRIPVPQRQEKKRKLFSFLDEESE